MTIEAPTDTWFKHLANGRFMIQRSASTGKHVFYPRMVVPGSGEADLEWVEPSGLGTVYSTTVVHQRPPTADYNLAIVELDEGPRLMTRVEGVTAAEVRIGMRVRARVMPAEQGDSMVVFDVEQMA
jgi:uncharacterized OB-fold protein